MRYLLPWGQTPIVRVYTVEAHSRFNIRVDDEPGLEATDVSVVHSGYAKRRCALVRAGIQLFELKRTAAVPTGKRRKRDEDQTTGSSAASLHAKTFAADGEKMFVGSFNFDPRSALLNTEMGLVIESPLFAQRLERTFDEQMRDPLFWTDKLRQLDYRGQTLAQILEAPAAYQAFTAEQVRDAFGRYYKPERMFRLWSAPEPRAPGEAAPTPEPGAKK